MHKTRNVASIKGGGNETQAVTKARQKKRHRGILELPGGSEDVSMAGVNVLEAAEELKVLERRLVC